MTDDHTARAEREIGRRIYARIAELMELRHKSDDAELDYLATLVEQVETDLFPGERGEVTSYPATAEVGDRLVCVHAGSTLLVNGATYLVHDVANLPPAAAVELAELRGFLFGLYRFKKA